MKKLITLVSAVAILMVVFFCLAALYNEFSRSYYNSVAVVEVQDAPYVHNGDNKPNPVLHPNDAYFLHIEVTMKAECRVETQNKIERRDDNLRGAVMYNYPFVKGTISSGLREVNEIFELPVKLPPGNYAHVRVSIFYCKGFEWSTVYPDALFTVADLTAPALVGK